VLLHSSGLHGVEGFAGSAIQTALLMNSPSLRPGVALVLVHCLNPYGMAWLRRVNEHNVDLNRNSPRDGFGGVYPQYAELDPFLNPPSPPTHDGYYRDALRAILRYGYRAVRQGIAAGQYEFPRGLFYGGAALEPGLAGYRDWLSTALGGTNAVMAVDVHTGLGWWGRQSLFLEGSRDGNLAASVRVSLGRRLRRVNTEPASYKVNGGLVALLEKTLHRPALAFLTEEFGTYNTLRVLRALREENRWHHFGEATLNNAVKTGIREVFCPASEHWRRKVLRQGVALAQRLIDTVSI
jgi:hypothetical protein